jgi:uncharacterized protein involved in exopolysaccharide biosynthesis
LERYVLLASGRRERDMNGNDEEAAEKLAVSARLFDSRDREKARNYASFVRGSVRRHRFLVFAVFVSIMGATVGSFFVLPKTYHVETKALAQPNSALTVRGDGPGADSLTRVAADTVLRQDNLLALIQQTDLLRYTAEHRAPAQRAKDAVVKVLHARDDSEADRLDALVKLLAEKLAVWTSDSGSTAGGSTVTIAIDWQDAPMACRLVDAAQRAFLDTRYAREVTALAESIEILGRHTVSLQADIEDAVGGIQRMRAARDGASTEVVPPPSPSSRPRMLPVSRPAPRRPSVPDPELQQLQTELQAKQRAIDEIEGLRHRQLADIQTRLAEARTTYTENHPVISDLKQSIAALSVEPAQIATLRQDAAALKAAYDSRSAGENDLQAPSIVWTTAPAGSASGASATPPQLPGDVLRLALDLREDRDPGMVYARGQLRDAMDKYAALRAQIQTAQIDLETAQAAFKYRYTVVTPAHLPKTPTVPNVPLVTLAALVAAILSALLAAVLADLRKGRLLERWQIEKLLGRPILGDIALLDDLERGDAE